MGERDEYDEELERLHAQVLSNVKDFRRTVARFEDEPWESVDELRRLENLKNRRDNLEGFIGEVVYELMASGGRVEIIPPDEADLESVREKQRDYELMANRPDRDKAREKIDNGDLPPIPEMQEIGSEIANDLKAPLPPENPSTRELRDEVDRIYDIVDFSAWQDLTEDLRQIVVSHVAARGNFVQSQSDGEPSDNIGVIYPKLTAFTNKYGGYVHGLARDHEPRTDSWREDAKRWRKEFDERLSWWAGQTW